MKLYKESNVVYQHQEIYEAMRELSEYRKKIRELGNLYDHPSEWVTSYSLGRQAGHTDFIKKIHCSDENTLIITGKRGLHGDNHFERTTTIKNGMGVMQVKKYDVLVDAGSAFEYSNIHDLYKFLEDHREYINSCVVIGS